MTGADDRLRGIADDRLRGTSPTAALNAAFEEAVSGFAADDDKPDLAGLAGLARFVDDVRLAASGSPPPRSPQLEALLLARRPAPATRFAAAAGPAPIAEPAGRRPRSGAPNATGPATRRRRPARRWAAGSLAGKAALVAGLAGAGAAAAGAAGVLPEPVAGVVRRVVELATPFELPADPIPTVPDPSGDAAGGVGSGLAASAPGPAGPAVVAVRPGGAGREVAGGTAEVGQVAGAEVIGEVESGGSLPADPVLMVGGPSPAPGGTDASAPPTTAPPPPAARPGSPFGHAAGPPAPAPGPQPAPGPVSSPAPPAGSACDGDGRCEPDPAPPATAPAQPPTSTSPGPAAGYPSVTYDGDDDAHDLDASSRDGQHGWS